jgi:hypothetical protein
LVKRIALLILFALLFLPSMGRAQEAVRLSTLDVGLWPEHDRPELLVIYRAALPPEVTLPAKITFRIPIEASKPNAVAVGVDAASVADVAYQTQVMGEWLEVSFVATAPSIQFEYYDPSLQVEGTQRSFQYTWPADYAVDALTLRVLHPIDSQDLTITPTTGRVVQNTDGTSYSVIDVGALPADSPFTIDVSYQKSSDQLNVQGGEVQPSSPITPPASQRWNLVEAWPWILGILGIVLIAGGGFWYWRSGQNGKGDAMRRRHGSPQQRAEEAAFREGLGEGVYCHQCGKRASAGDRFCRSCGTRLRAE